MQHPIPNPSSKASTQGQVRTGLGRLLVCATLALGVHSASQAQSYLNVTVGGNFAPGVYGQIALGNNPAPPVWNTQPQWGSRPVYGATPTYLYVPQAHSRDWSRYCNRYQACGLPVYFVRAETQNPWWEREALYRRATNPSYYAPPVTRARRDYETYNPAPVVRRQGDYQSYNSRDDQYRRDHRDARADYREARDDRRDDRRDRRHGDVDRQLGWER